MYRVMYLGGYDVLKGEVLFQKQKRQHSAETSTTPAKLSWGERILSAQAISLTAGTISYPFDSVRRRMMMQAGVPAGERLYRNSIHCITTVLKEEGFTGFYLGIGPNIVRSLGGAIMLVGYDSIRAMLK